MLETKTYAQTNIQLFNQARQEGYEASDIARLAEAYRFSLTLFSGRFRVSGKTFFAHLVGTASVLVSLRVDSALVSAGLLHATYTHGDFGDGRRGMTDAKRAMVRDGIGERIEAYIARYTTFEWSAESIPRLAAMVDALDDVDREVIAIRLANELDEYLDYGVLYEGGDRQRVIDQTSRTQVVLAQIAERLGWPQLSREITRMLDATMAADVQNTLAEPAGADESFVVPPASCRRLMESIAARMSTNSTRGV
jgi:(p)ppGpp synthase/HD superfamily hydrolase